MAATGFGRLTQTAESFPQTAPRVAGIRFLLDHATELGRRCGKVRRVFEDIPEVEANARRFGSQLDRAAKGGKRIVRATERTIGHAQVAVVRRVHLFERDGSPNAVDGR